jgi:hypothetical protein
MLCRLPVGTDQSAVLDGSERDLIQRLRGAALTTGKPNNSLDASGTSGFVIDNLNVAWWPPAASTQTLGVHRFEIQASSNQKNLDGRNIVKCRCRLLVGAD